MLKKLQISGRSSLLLVFISLISMNYVVSGAEPPGAEASDDLQPIDPAKIEAALQQLRKLSIKSERFLKNDTTRLDKKTVSEMEAKGEYTFSGFLSYGHGEMKMKGHGDQDLTEFLQYSVTVCPEEGVALNQEVEAYNAAVKRAALLGKTESKVFGNAGAPTKEDVDRVKKLIKQLPLGVLPIPAYSDWGVGMGLYDETGVAFPIEGSDDGYDFKGQALPESLRIACSPKSIRPVAFDRFLSDRKARAALIDQLWISDLSTSQREEVKGIRERGEKTFLYVSQLETGPLFPHIHYRVVDKHCINQMKLTNDYWDKVKFSEIVEYWLKPAVCFYLDKAGDEKVRREGQTKISDSRTFKQYYLPLN